MFTAEYLSVLACEYVWIDGIARPVNTEEQQTAASRMLSEAGINSAVVWRNGERTHLILLADSDVDPVANGTKVG